MEQETVSKASTRTILVLGEVQAPIGLYKATRDPVAQRKWAKPPEPKEEGEEDTLTDALTGTKKTATKKGGSKGTASTGKSSSSKKAAGKDEDVQPEKPRKGILKEDGAFVDLTDHIAAIAERTTLDCLEVVSFIRREQVPRERISEAFYVGAGGGKKKGPFPPSKVLALLYRGLKSSGRAAVVRWGKRTKSAVGVMVPHPSGALVVLELAYAENTLAPSPDCLTHNHVEVSESKLTQIADLIATMADSRASLDDIRDHRASLEDELVVRAEHGELDEYEALSYETDDHLEDLGHLFEDSLQTAAA